VVACKVPSTRLKDSESGDFLAVGGSDGSVNVFKTGKLEKVSSQVCHDLPVTGLGFAPHGFAYPLVGTPELVVSCSADNKVAALKVGGISTLFIVVMIVLTVLFLLSLTSLTVLIFFEDLSLQILRFIVTYGSEMKYEL
jgi:WD40 repeat protein